MKTDAPSSRRRPLADFAASLRQLSVPAPLRIAAPAGIAGHEALSTLAAELTQIAALLKQLLEKPAVNPPSGGDDAALRRQLADLATGWWRIWRKTLQPGTERPLEEMRRIFTFVEGLRDTLEQMGVEVIDHTGKEIPVGLSLDVLDYKVVPGLKRDRVSETVRPTIYYKEAMIQMGRVYAETPPREEAAKTT